MHNINLFAARMTTVAEKFHCIESDGKTEVEEITSRADCFKDPSKGYSWVAKTGDDVENAKGNISGIIINIINIILGIIGLVAVVMIILGGISYMTSAGDSSKVKKGKDTILYGIIGLIIVGLAFAIVNFVIANIINAA